MSYVVKGIDNYYNKAKYDPDPFPVRVGDEVFVKVLCKSIFKNVDPFDEQFCYAEDQCNIKSCPSDFEEVVLKTKVQSIFDRGHGWQIFFEGVCCEYPMDGFETTFWKKEIET